MRSNRYCPLASRCKRKFIWCICYWGTLKTGRKERNWKQLLHFTGVHSPNPLHPNICIFTDSVNEAPADQWCKLRSKVYTHQEVHSLEPLRSQNGHQKVFSYFTTLKGDIWGLSNIHIEAAATCESFEKFLLQKNLEMQWDKVWDKEKEG